MYHSNVLFFTSSHGLVLLSGKGVREAYFLALRKGEGSTTLCLLS